MPPSGHYVTLPKPVASSPGAGDSGGSSGGSGSSGGGGLTPTQQNAYDTLKALFHTYDLDSLAPEILKLIQQGYTNDTIPTMLATRFARRMGSVLSLLRNT